MLEIKSVYSRSKLSHWNDGRKDGRCRERGEAILFKYGETGLIFKQSLLEDLHSVVLGCAHEK